MTNTLSLEAIQELIADSRTRGGYASDLRDFFKSGDLAIDFTEKYPKKEAASLRNSVKQNIDKLRSENPESVPTVQIVMSKNGDNTNVIVVNMDAYAAQQAAQNETDEA